MSNATPGPWEIKADKSHFDSLSDVYGGAVTKTWPGRQLMVSVGGSAEWREQEANARLIAASPDLLEALQRLLRANEADYEHLPDMDVRTSFETNSMAVNQARAAIAKATGAAP